MSPAEVLQESLASLGYILPGGLKISRIPGVRHVPALFGKIQQPKNFVTGISACDGLHIPDIPMVHADQIVEGLIV